MRPINQTNMRQVTKQVTDAFLSGRAKKVDNTHTDGRSLWLFFNKIAEHREDGLYVSNCGYKTRTTAERLRALPNVNLTSKRGEWYLNGEAWNGEWRRVNTNPRPIADENVVGSLFDLTKKWVSIDGYRGYEEPVYAVCGANDTGMWSDSPCPSNVAEAELKAMESVLDIAKIPHKLHTCETSNVFCVHHYLVVPPKFVDKARKLVDNHLESATTRLLYRVDAV